MSTKIFSDTGKAQQTGNPVSAIFAAAIITVLSITIETRPSAIVRISKDKFTCNGKSCKLKNRDNREAAVQNSPSKRPAAPKQTPEQACKNLRTLARMFMSYDKYDKAKPLINRALHIAATQNVSNKQFSACLLDAGWMYKGTGKYDQAIEMYQDGIKVTEIAYGTNHPYLSAAMRNLAEIYRLKGWYTKSRQMFEKAAAILENTQIDNHRNIAPLWVDIANLLTIEGNLTEAENKYYQAVEIIKKTYGPNHSYTAKVLTGAAELYLNQQRFAEARTLIDRALKIQTQLYGQQNLIIVKPMLISAAVTQAQNPNDNITAAQTADQAVTIITKALGPSHPKTAMLLQKCAEIYLRSENYNKAENTAQKALNIANKTIPETDVQAMACITMARVQLKQNNPNQARSLCEKSKRIIENKFSTNHYLMAKVFDTFASIETQLGNSLRADEYTQRATNIRAAASTASKPLAQLL